jgi:hypothetical protein
MMMLVTEWQYLLLCILSTLALFATAVWPAPREDIWQQASWAMSIAGWGFITFRLWLGVMDTGDRSVSVVGAVGVTLLAAAAVVRRVSSVSRS